MPLAKTNSVVWRDCGTYLRYRKGVPLAPGTRGRPMGKLDHKPQVSTYSADMLGDRLTDDISLAGDLTSETLYRTSDLIDLTAKIG